MSDLTSDPSATIQTPSEAEAEADPARKRKKKKASAAPPPPRPEIADPPLGSAKAVETMFRNAVRAELDLIQLAATKANIMISLNGFIISALVISGAFLFNTAPSFILPAAVFLISSAASIIFALFAASPDRADLAGSILRWVRDVIRRRAPLSALRDYVMRGRVAKPAGELNPLIYEERIQLDPEAHWQRMREVMSDREDVYRKMTDQLYWLGQMGNRKFKLLNVSYTIFRWGLLATVVVFLGARSVQGLFPSLSGAAAAPGLSPGVAEIPHVHEPSAVVALPDGRILAAEDEPKRAFSILGVDANGILREDAAPDLALIRGFGRKLSDLEGLTTDPRGHVYAITSHSRDKGGNRSPDREQLVRFRLSGNMVGEVAAVENLRDTLAGSGVAAKIGQMTADEPPDFDELNIEGLDWNPATGHLLLGIREPTAGSLSIIIPIVNPDDMFAGRPAVFGDPILVDIGGGGIRSLNFDPVLDDFLIVNELRGADGNFRSRLWRWSGAPGDKPEPVDLPGISDLTNVEAMTSITVAGEPSLLLMSDEGDAKKMRPGRYLIRSYSEFPD